MAFDFSKLADPTFQAMMHREAKENPQTSGKGQAGLTESTGSVSKSASYDYDEASDARFEAALSKMGGSGNMITEEQMMAQRGMGQQQQRQYTEGVDPMPYRENKESRLPAAILSTLKKNQGLHEQMSVAQGITSGVEQLAAKMPKKQIVAETVTPTPTATIDYSLIKTIVEECIDRKLKENVLNESALRTVVLKGGKIRLVDNSGNIYEAKLERKGNVNDKK